MPAPHAKESVATPIGALLPAYEGNIPVPIRAVIHANYIKCQLQSGRSLMQMAEWTFTNHMSFAGLLGYVFLD